MREQQTPSEQPRPTGPAPLPLPRLGWPKRAVRAAMRLDPLALYEYGQRRHGDVVLYDSGVLNYCVAATPAAVEHVLLRAYKRYDKCANHPILNRLLGEGVIMTNGDRWRGQRKALAPAFRPKSLDALVAGTARLTDSIADEWLAQAGRPVDLYAQTSLLTRRVVGEALFGTELGRDGDLAEAVDIVVDRANIRSQGLFPAPLWVPTRRNRKFHWAVDLLDDVVYRLIAERRANPKHDDILTMLISAHEHSGMGEMDDKELRDEILNLYLAGFETSTAALVWTFFLLSKFPAVAAKVVAEAREVCGDALVDYQDARRLEFTEMVMNESMRLYPPIWTNERLATEDDVVCGYHIPRGTMVAISTWLLHRNPRVWARPNEFDPLRFSKERSVDRPKYAFVPFGAGPRTCVGNHFAALQSRIIIASLLRRLSVHVHTSKPKATPTITLLPDRLIGEFRPVQA